MKARNLPHPLRDAIHTFKPIAWKNGYGCKEGAEGLCLEATNDFLIVLDGYIPIKGGYSFIREYIFDPMNKKEALVQKFDDYLDSFPFDPDGCRFHFVAKVDEFIIDWTARQFGEHHPFPAIWREQ